MIKRLFSTNAEYKVGVKRGTAGLFESKHFKQLREGYQPYQLRINFWGPKEWFHLARLRAERLNKKSFADIVSIQKSILRMPTD